MGSKKIRGIFKDSDLVLLLYFHRQRFVGFFEDLSASHSNGKQRKLRKSIYAYETRQRATTFKRIPVTSTIH